MKPIMLVLFAIVLLAGCADRVIWDDNGKVKEATEDREIWNSEGKINSGERKIWNKENGEPVVK